MINLKDLRKSLKLSQTELADKLGVTQPTVSAWESGKCAMDSMTVHKLCTLFNITPNQLYGYPEEYVQRDPERVSEPELPKPCVVFTDGTTEPLTMSEQEFVLKAILKHRRECTPSSTQLPKKNIYQPQRINDPKEVDFFGCDNTKVAI